MSPKPRKKENKPYPKRWRLKHGQGSPWRIGPALKTKNAMGQVKP